MISKPNKLKRKGIIDYFSVTCGEYYITFSAILSTCVMVCMQPKSGKWAHWNSMIAEETDDFEYSKKKIQDTLVPTLDTVRYQYMMDLCIKQSRLPSFCFIAFISISDLL